MSKSRHGMGVLCLGSTVTMLRMKYGSKASTEFTERVAREMAVAGWETGLELAREKGPAPIMVENFQVDAEMLRKRPEMVKDGWKIGQKIPGRSEEHTSELQSLMRNSSAVFCLTTKKTHSR